MAIAKSLYSSNKDEYETPKDLFDELNKTFEFELDPCARLQLEGQHRIKTKIQWTIDDDGLTRDWPNLSTFVNPPYSQINTWVQKCMDEYAKRAKNFIFTSDNAKSGKIAPEPIVMLIPARTDTRWFHKLLEFGYSKVIFIKGRLKFGPGSKPGNAPFPSCVVVLGKSSYLDKMDILTVSAFRFAKPE